MRAFTLIELLIVVAIIAILAAIAVPNFLEAQTRAKAARVKGELRTIATAIESYAVDWNKPAPHGLVGWNYPPGTPFAHVTLEPGDSATGTLTCAITTPVAYLTTFLFFDPFIKTDRSIPLEQRLYTYHAYQWKYAQPHPPDAPPHPDSWSEPVNEGLSGEEFQRLYGRYRILSAGPDRDYFNGLTAPNCGPVNIIYDPTNGTTSIGNIIRSQQEPEQRSFAR